MTSAPAIYDYMSQFKNGEGGIYNITNLNLYRYAGNNPIKYTDQDGRSPQPEVMTSVGAVAVSTEAIAVKGIENFVGKSPILTGIFLILILLTGDSQPTVKNEQIQEQAPSPTTDEAHEAAGEAKGDVSANENNDSHPPYPGDDPTKAPEGTEWKGAPGSKPGDSNGNYYNPETGESFHPDLNHPPGKNVKGPHWDYSDGTDWYRIYPDGSMEPK